MGKRTTLIIIVVAAGFILGAGGQASPDVIVEVSITGPADMDSLTGWGFNVSHVFDTRAFVHVTEDELAILAALGFSPERRDPYSSPQPPLTAEDPKALAPPYHTYATLTADMTAYAADHSSITRLFTLGTSVQGRELWAMLISDNPDDEEDEPEFKYVSTMHGIEPVGMEMCVYFIDLLVNNYGSDTRITDLIDSTAIWIVPLMNPDGLELGSRDNAQGFDLNRNFPEWPEDWQGTIFDGAPLDNAGRPPEISHVMEWTASNSFVLSANFHTGALVVNYPYDDDNPEPHPILRSYVDAPTPDDLLFEDISLRYSAYNLPMWNSPTFPQGITNGALWYEIWGGMQDWNYRYASCNEVTIELSNTFIPPAANLPGLWDDNRESMLTYLEAVHIGIRGLVTDHATGEPVYAKVLVAGNAHPVYTDPDVGDYHRMLLPGTYTLHYVAPGYLTKTVLDVMVFDGPATRVDVTLFPQGVFDTDINDNGSVNAIDIQLVINAALGLPVPYDCDIDGGGVTATDIQLVINGALGLL